MYRTKSQRNKGSNLPAGISLVIRKYRRCGRSSYPELQVYWKDENGKVRIKHFPVSSKLSPMECVVRRLHEAIEFRRAYERRVDEAVKWFSPERCK